MIGISYSIMGVLAIVIHCTINKDSLFLMHKDDDTPNSMICYRKFLWAILAYYITDTMWGILDSLGWVEVLRVDTFVYYIAMSIAVVLWCDYVVAYIHQENKFGNAMRYLGRIFVIFELAALIFNFYRRIFFWFDEEGVYHAGPVRYIALYVQIVMFLLVTAQAVFVTVRTKGVQRRRHLAICLFGFSMIVAIIVQIHYPMLPIYTIGYLIGACFLHTFVGQDEKDEYIENIQKQMDIVSSMAGIYFCSYYVDMRSRTFVEIDNKIAENANFIGKKGDAIETLDKMCKVLVLPEYMKEMQEFTNLDTLDERMNDKKYYVSTQFESIHIGWAEGFFIASDRDENGKLKHVIWAIRTINDEKRKEENLVYNSYVDELTGLYNRKMYFEDSTENADKIMGDNFVYICMDVNGLKTINDTKGHAAGDEMIKGAAECMKKAMGPFGRIYRTGGDEFIALLNADAEQLQQIKDCFERITGKYQGKYVESISVSCGYVVKKEHPELSLTEIEKLADKNMYLAKREHYRTKGVDRREQQQSAYKALCALYTKILLINLTENKYSIITMDESEQSEDKGFSDDIFDWLENFAKSGQVHPDDVENYLSKTNREYLTGYFKRDKMPLSIYYRRKSGDKYILTEMEMIPSENYTDDNQNLYLYVKAIDK